VCESEQPSAHLFAILQNRLSRDKDRFGSTGRFFLIAEKAIAVIEERCCMSIEHLDERRQIGPGEYGFLIGLRCLGSLVLIRQGPPTSTAPLCLERGGSSSHVDAT
jgi:hypothetical protein